MRIELPILLPFHAGAGWEKRSEFTVVSYTGGMRNGRLRKRGGGGRNWLERSCEGGNE